MEVKMETEITVQVFNKLEEIQKILKGSGFEMIESYQLNDWYFSKYEDISFFGYQDLLNNSFLVRQIIDDNPQIQLCYKKKVLDENNNVISEEKTNTTIKDLEKTLQIFKMANLNNYCVLKNNSYVYKKDEICFVVQCIKDLGIFIEYEEDDSMKNMNEKEKFNYMSKIVKQLGLKLGQNYSCKKVYMKIKNM